MKHLSDKELWKIIEVFDACIECWDWAPRRCKYRPLRKKLGLRECSNYESTQHMKSLRKEWKREEGAKAILAKTAHRRIKGAT